MKVTRKYRTAWTTDSRPCPSRPRLFHLPSEAKGGHLRRAVHRSQAARTRPRLIAAIAGTEHATGGGVQRRSGHHHRKRSAKPHMPAALVPIVATARLATSRSETRRRRTMAPPGICPIKADQGRRSTAQDRSRPGSTSASSDRPRQTDRSRSAHPREKKMKPVEAAQALSRGGPAACASSVPASRTGSPPTAAGLAGGAYRSGRSAVWMARHQQSASPNPIGHIAMACRLPEAPSTTIGVSSLYFRRRRHLLLGQLERDAVALIGNAARNEARFQSNHDFSGCRRPRKTAEINDGRAPPFRERSTITSTMRPHVLVGRACEPRGRARHEHPWHR